MAGDENSSLNSQFIMMTVAINRKRRLMAWGELAARPPSPRHELGPHPHGAHAPRSPPRIVPISSLILVS